MERNCLHTSLKYQKLNTRAIAGGGEGGGGGGPNSLKNQKNKLEEDYINGLSWPPRCYTCNFCKREFRSAQALGGHMNVHRRDRAMLRQYSPPTDGQYTNLSLNLQHNPNPNLSSSYSASFSETKKWGGAVEDIAYDPFNLRVSDFKKPVETAKPSLFERGRNAEDFARCGDWNKAEKIIRLDMEISTVLTDSKKDIDLELRLGYSS